MEQLIPIASKLQDVLGALGQNTTLDLPQIVVVGGQSSGKSSVLESIVGRSFLPRGHGIVTRRPLVLQLYNTAAPAAPAAEEEEPLGPGGNDAGDDDDPSRDRDEGRSTTYRQLDSDVGDDDDHADDEWGEFLHLPGRQFRSFTSIRDEILNDTNRLVGTNKGINRSPIHLKIFSPRVLALTLVDLPGMAKVAVGDQPADIEDQIRDMCLSYVSNPNAIVLAVTGANADLANSDALKLAQEVDPYGDRTIGVLTKLDLMDPGTDASDALHNKVVPLRRGYVAVVNRGQRDVESDVPIRDGLRKESNFFRTHPVYGRDRSLASKCGASNLAKTLNNILMHHIRECLPELKNRIANMMMDVQGELDALGTTTDTTSRSILGSTLLGLLSKFTSNFAGMIGGSGNVSANQAASRGLSAGGNAAAGSEVTELYGGARISFIFNDVFSSSLMSVGPFDGLGDEEIRTTICNANGTRPALFVPEISFDILARRQISRLEQPGLQCVDLVYEELQRIASQCEPSELMRFPTLRDRMVEVVSGLLKRCVGPTQMMVSNLVKIELAYINTSHPDFIGGSRAVAKLMEKMGKEERQSRNRRAQSQPQTEPGPPEQQRPASDDPATTPGGMGGATPISSSSLNEYCAMDDEGISTTPARDSTDVNVGAASNGDNGDNGPLPPAYDPNGGGIMNFIFRGSRGNNPPPPPNRVANPSAGGYQSNGGIGSGGGGINGGPPSIVQLPQVPDTMRQTDVPPTDREQVETEIIKSLIESYFSIVRKNYIDMVPKTIMYFLVNHVKDAMQNELVSELYRDHEIVTLMKEAEDIAQRRKTCEEMRDLLSKALEIVNEVRDFNTFK